MDSLLEEKLFNLISVRPPYFALDGVHEFEGAIRAKIPCQEKSSAEVGPISAAEAFRHMAVLGSYAASLFNEQKGRHCYLEKRGEIQCFNYLAGRETLVAEARGRVISKQEAIATIELSTEKSGDLVFSAEIYYQVIPIEMFERIYGERRTGFEPTPNEGSIVAGPYPMYKKRYSDDARKLSATIGRIKPEYCLGHFDQYPCLPIAFALSTMAKASGDFLARVVNRNVRYAIRDAVVNVDSLAFAGDEMDLTIEYMGNYRKNCHSFKCQALGEGKTFIELYINMLEIDVLNREKGFAASIMDMID